MDRYNVKSSNMKASLPHRRRVNVHKNFPRITPQQQRRLRREALLGIRRKQKIQVVEEIIAPQASTFHPPNLVVSALPEIPSAEIINPETCRKPNEVKIEYDASMQYRINSASLHNVGMEDKTKNETHEDYTSQNEYPMMLPEASLPQYQHHQSQSLQHQQQLQQQQQQQYGQMNNISIPTDLIFELRRINERLDKIDQRFERVEKFLELQKQRGQAPKKPDFIPMKSIEEVLNFERASDDDYDALVRYLEHLGGFTLREALNLCVKKVLTNDVAVFFTWWGKNTGHQPQCVPLHNKQITQAIYDAVSNSPYFERPRQDIFSAQMREALRVAKQRNRNSMRKEGPSNPLDEENSDRD